MRALGKGPCARLLCQVLLLLLLQRCLLLHILLLHRWDLLLLLLLLVKCCLWLAKADRSHWAQATCINVVGPTKGMFNQPTRSARPRLHNNSLPEVVLSNQLGLLLPR
jgi:uncharacterized membrane protein YoaT (DUF817 family)